MHNKLFRGEFDVVIFTVAHNNSEELNIKIITNENRMINDVKDFLPMKWWMRIVGQYS
ncbi:MAG: hypothetical protein M0R38_10405 [Bacteroidia bacterium]|nr:hypothetical protein [Bacteroidia bacterium]